MVNTPDPTSSASPSQSPLPASEPVVPAGATSMIPALPDGVHVASPWLRLGSYLLEGVLATVTLGIGWLVWAAMVAGTGQTPAKRLLKLRVIGADSLQPTGFARMLFMRGIVAGWVAAIAITLTLGILLFMPFWDRRRQNIWDKVSNTYVVTDPDDAWNTRPDLR